MKKLLIILITIQITTVCFALEVDQSNDDFIGASATVAHIFFQGRWSWQEFKPTINNIQQVDLLLMNDNAPLNTVIYFQLRNNSGSTLWETSFSINELNVFQFEWISLEVPNIELVPETTYKLCLTSSVAYNTQSMYPLWYGSRNNLYDRGVCIWPDEEVDLAFRTWGVPEPATVALFAFGGLLLRKRK